ncbi:MAG: hypothetical protein KatS3mg018_1323 [Fimbriimonadales bacterium]|nr:MAG: hypothetical protein KatS3mg018_1323 [Fimbriimonadales bacterium]
MQKRFIEINGVQYPWLGEVFFPETRADIVLDDGRRVVFVENETLFVDRLDPSFWGEQWGDIYQKLDACPFEVRLLGEFIPEKVERFGRKFPGITYGQVGRREYPPKGTRVSIRNGVVNLRLPDGARARGVAYLQVRNLRRTGIDIYQSPPEKRYIAEGTHNDLLRSRLLPGDLILVNSGIGSLGRCAVVPEGIGTVNISQHIDRIVLNGICPEWTAMFLQSGFGACQMSRWFSGVSGQIKIDFKEVRVLRIPVPDEAIQQAVAREYWRMAAYHAQAMQARALGDDPRAEGILQIATGMLETLLAQVESLITGEHRAITPLIPDNPPPKLKRFLEDEYRRIGQIYEEIEEYTQRGRDEADLLGIPLRRDAEIVDLAARVLQLVESLTDDGSPTQ